MNSYFDREVLMQSSIFELRNIARDIGVYSPTIYKKDELIDKIYEILNGDTKPHVPKSKQGRPPKSLSDPNRKSVLDMVLPTEKRYNVEWQEMPCLSESVRAYLEDDNGSKTTYEVKGVLDVLEQGYGFVRGEKTEYTAFAGAYVSTELIKSNNLQAGDHIQGRAKLLADDKPLVLFEIDKVNQGVDICNGEFEKLDVTYSLSNLSMCDDIENFVVGASNLIMQNKDCKRPSKEYVENISPNSTLIYVGLEFSKELQLQSQDYVGEVYYTSMTATPIEHIHLIKLALARAKRLVSFGKDVVLYIDSIDKVIKNQNLVCSSNLLDIKSNTLDMVKEITMAARQLAKVGSLTLVGIYNYHNGDAFDTSIVGELHNYFTRLYNEK